MKRFITQTFLYAGILVLLLALMNSYYWHVSKASSFEMTEDEGLVLKYETFKQRDQVNDFNTLFLGSSRIYRHINPQLFDSLTGTTKSYNLAFSNLFPFRLNDFAVKVLNDKKRNDVTVFMELAPIASVGKNFNSMPIKKSVTIDRVQTAGSFFKTFSKGGSVAGYAEQVRYMQAFFWKYGSPGTVQQYVQKITALKQNEIKNEVNGYYALDQETSAEFLDRKLTTTDTLALTFQNPVLQRVDHLMKGKDPYFDNLMALTVRLKNAGAKEIIFVIPPRIEGHVTFIAAYYQKLEAAGFRIINLSQPDKFPELYKLEYSYDHAHLNNTGARYLTRYLATIYQQQ